MLMIQAQGSVRRHSFVGHVHRMKERYEKKEDIHDRWSLLPFSTSLHTDPNESMKERGEVHKKKRKASFLEMDLIFGPKLNFVKNTL